MSEKRTEPSALTLERTFDATPKDLWEAWIDPEKYARWHHPTPGVELVIKEWDAQEGGRVVFDMPVPEGEANRQEWVFQTLEPHARIVMGAPDAPFLIDVTFRPEDDGTKMVLEATGLPPEHEEMATEGWNAGFDKLDDLLASHEPV